MRFLCGLALAGLLAACGDDGREELESLAKKQALCESAADCCVVRDGCMATAYVVGADDYEHARDVAAGLDDSSCAKCPGTPVHLDCVEGSCMGVASGDPEEYGDHCGEAEPINDSPPPEGSQAQGLSDGRIFDCGG